MVTKKIIKDYNFESIDDYFDYIITSKINGQHEQVRNLVHELSKAQKRDCLDYFETLDEIDMYRPQIMDDCKKTIINSL